MMIARWVFLLLFFSYMRPWLQYSRSKGVVPYTVVRSFGGGGGIWDSASLTSLSIFSCGVSSLVLVPVSSPVCSVAAAFSEMCCPIRKVELNWETALKFDDPDIYSSYMRNAHSFWLLNDYTRCVFTFWSRHRLKVIIARLCFRCFFDVYWSSI